VLAGAKNGGGVEGAADDDARKQNFRVGLISRRGFDHLAGVNNERLPLCKQGVFVGAVNCRRGMAANLTSSRCSLSKTAHSEILEN